MADETTRSKAFRVSDIDVNEQYPKSAPESPEKEVRRPGPLAAGLSKALMQGAFSKFGEAFTATGDVRKDAQTRESRLAPYVEAGGGAAEALANRWHTMEYENFKTQHIDPWVEQSKGLLDDYQRRHAQADEGVFEGPDGMPVQVDITTKEGRLKAIRMRSQLTKKFYSLKTDMDLELYNEAGKYDTNPMITGRAMDIQKATSAALTQTTNPAGALETEDKMSEMRAREANAEAQMAQARATASKADMQKRPQSWREAMNHPEIGAAGIMQWFISAAEGMAILDAPSGGDQFLVAETKIARGEIMKSNPDIDDINDSRIDTKLESWAPRIRARAAAKYLKHLDPKAYEEAKVLTPWFFDKDKDPKEVGIVSSERQDPKVRQANVDTWKKHAQAHFEEYMADPANDANIDAALDNLEQWLSAAVYGDTGESELQEVTAARGKGNRRYVSDILEQIPLHIRRWWASEKGSGIAQEENVGRAAQARAAAGAGGRQARRAARILERERKKKRDKGILP